MANYTLNKSPIASKKRITIHEEIYAIYLSKITTLTINTIQNMPSRAKIMTGNIGHKVMTQAQQKFIDDLHF